MMKSNWTQHWLAFAIIISACVLGTGCHLAPRAPEAAFEPLPPILPVPRELEKTVLPTYTIEPPDILTIEAIRVIPKAPYRLRSLDVVTIDVSGTLPDLPIAGAFPIEPGGTVNLGSAYGNVRVAGMTVDEARVAIEQHLKETLRAPQVAVALAELSATQHIAGEFMVSWDGTVRLGSYGSIPVVGLTLDQAQHAIEAHLSQFLDQPRISVDVFAYNSRAYYIVLQGAGLGDRVYRLPFTGNETVLDAIANIQGLEQLSSKRIWVARPTRSTCNAQVLPVDWCAVTQGGVAATNYQLMPGDRVFVEEDKMVALDTKLAKLFAPFERIMGFTLLGTETVTRLSGPVLRGGGNPLGQGAF